MNNNEKYVMVPLGEYEHLDKLRNEYEKIVDELRKREDKELMQIRYSFENTINSMIGKTHAIVVMNPQKLMVRPQTMFSYKSMWKIVPIIETVEIKNKWWQIWK